MGWIGLIICYALAYYLYIDISDIPFSNLTLKMISQDVLCGFLVYWGALLLDK